MNHDEIVTSDMSRFGNRERAMAGELLTAMSEQGADFLEDGVTVSMNMNSGYVFLTDEDYKVGMMNGKVLEQWFNCPYCGVEGFLEDMEHDAEDSDCDRYLIEIGGREDCDCEIDASWDLVLCKAHSA